MARKRKGAKKKSKNMKPGTQPRSSPVAAVPATPAPSTAAQGSGSGAQSLAQLRAKDALEKIKAIRGQNHSWESNYLSYVKALPATILMSGLGQALAMVKAGANKKGDVRDANAKLFDHMDNWLCSKWAGRTRQGDILNRITTDDEPDYIAAQAEAMEYLEWLKKFAVAYLVEKTDESGGE